MKRRCEFTKENGLKCKNTARPNKQFCYAHARDECASPMMAGPDGDCSESSDFEVEEPPPKRASVVPPPKLATPSHSSQSQATRSQNIHVDATGGSCMDDVLKALTERLQHLELSMRSRMRMTPRKTTFDKVKKAKLLYYHEHKKNDDVVEPLRATFRHLGYPEDAPIPWQVVKRKCDAQFDALHASDKDRYFKEACDQSKTT